MIEKIPLSFIIWLQITNWRLMFSFLGLSVLMAADCVAVYVFYGGRGENTNGGAEKNTKKGKRDYVRILRGL